MPYIPKHVRETYIADRTAILLEEFNANLTVTELADKSGFTAYFKGQNVYTLKDGIKEHIHAEDKDDVFAVGMVINKLIDADKVLVQDPKRHEKDQSFGPLSKEKLDRQPAEPALS